MVLGRTMLPHPNKIKIVPNSLVPEFGAEALLESSIGPRLGNMGCI